MLLNELKCPTSHRAATLFINYRKGFILMGSKSHSSPALAVRSVRDEYAGRSLASPKEVFYPPFPIFAVFLLSSSLLIPKTMLITGLSGQEERRNPSLCLGMSHPLALFIHLKNTPPLPVLSLGGSWRVARDNHSLIFYLFLLNKASCSLQADFVQLPPSCAPHSANRE